MTTKSEKTGKGKKGRRETITFKTIPYESLAERLKSGPGVYVTVRPGHPDTKISSPISPVRVGNKGYERVHTLAVPIGDFVVLNPGDLNQSVHFLPRNSSGRLVPGRVEIYNLSSLGGKKDPQLAWDILDIEEQPSIVRRWNLGYLLSPGDQLMVDFKPLKTPKQKILTKKILDAKDGDDRVKLVEELNRDVETSGRTLDPVKSELEYTVTAKELTIDSAHLRRFPKEQCVFLPGFEEDSSHSTPLTPNTREETSIIHTVSFPVGIFGGCEGLNFSPRDSDGNLLKGTVEVIAVNKLRGVVRTVVKGNVTERPFEKTILAESGLGWFTPGTEFVTKVNLNDVLDPTKTLFELRTLIMRISP